jgi:two-component system KDP operon response regulator KdpE
VLLVEDEPDLIDVMEFALRRGGHDVVVVRSGAHAVQITQSRHIDVVTVDRGLPDMDGTVVTAQMRAGGFQGGILVTSGHSGRDHENACRSAGADGVLGKPFTLSELVGRVEELIGAAEAVQAPARSLVHG